MYGLPNDIDLSFLLQATLQQACFGANELILRFDSDTVVTVESSYTVALPGQAAVLYDDVRSSALSVVALIEKRVTAVEGAPGGTLSVQFDHEYRLDIYDSSRQYESYQIVHGDKVIVV